jgi:hypothetical protein
VERSGSLPYGKYGLEREPAGARMIFQGLYEKAADYYFSCFYFN